MTNKQASDELRRVLDKEPDIGAAKIISDWFLEPPNIFDRNARKTPKPEILMVVIYIVLMATVCAAFNWT